MRTVLIVAMLICLGVCVGAALAGAPVLAFAGSLGGLALLAVAVEHSRPSHWGGADVEHGRHRRD